MRMLMRCSLAVAGLLTASGAIGCDIEGHWGKLTDVPLPTSDLVLMLEVDEMAGIANGKDSILITVTVRSSSEQTVTLETSAGHFLAVNSPKKVEARAEPVNSATQRLERYLVLPNQIVDIRLSVKAAKFQVDTLIPGSALTVQLPKTLSISASRFGSTQAGHRASTLTAKVTAPPGKPTVGRVIEFGIYQAAADGVALIPMGTLKGGSDATGAAGASLIVHPSEILPHNSDSMVVVVGTTGGDDGSVLSATAKVRYRAAG